MSSACGGGNDNDNNTNEDNDNEKEGPVFDLDEGKDDSSNNLNNDEFFGGKDLFN